MTFRRRLLTTYLLLFVIAISLLSLHVYQRGTRWHERSIVRSLVDDSTHSLDSIDDLFNRLQSAMTSLDKVRAWTDGSPVSYVNYRLSDYCTVFGGLDRLTLYDDHGTIIGDSGNKGVGERDPNESWQAAITGRAGYRMGLDRETGTRAYYLYRRVVSTDGRIVRVLIGRVPFASLGKMVHGFKSYESFTGVDFHVVLVSGGGIVLHTSEPGGSKGGVGDWHVLKNAADRLWHAGQRHEVSSDRERITTLALPEPGSGRETYPWLLKVDAPKNALFAESRKKLVEMALFGAILAGSSSLVIWYIALRLSRPVEELVRHAAFLGKGDFSSLSALGKREDEFGMLVDSFRAMGEKIEVVIRQLRESEEKFRMVAEFTADWEYWIGPDMALLFVSPSCETVTGYTAEDFMNDPELMLTIVHPEDVDTARKHFLKVRMRGAENDHFPLEFRIVRRDGSVRWVSHVCRTVVSEEGENLGRRGANRDVTERKAAEEEVRRLNGELEELVMERTSELEHINKELAGFCYAISHELRAPVARLQGFSKLLREGCASEDDRNFVCDRIEIASCQLQTVIDSILMLSRLSRMELNRTAVDLTAVGREVVASLEGGAHWHAHRVTVQEGMRCHGDQDLLHICVENLVGNAVKYSSKVSEPRVAFGMEKRDNGTVFYVRDNGVGFDMEFVDKLFVPFQRLHLQEDFPGTGIGLATVLRILERHGGRIWAEGKEGEGATFFFTLAD